MSRIFISHSGQDSFEALAFKSWLVGEGWHPDDVFLDLHDIGAGQRWKEALAKANERCEAVVLLASPASLASTECRLEIRMAEDYGKEIIVAILYLLTPDADELGVYRERQIVDLGQEPRDATFTVEHKGQRKAVSFNGRTLKHIKARLDQLGISPTSFSWRPGNLEAASPYPGFEGFGRQEAGLFFGRAGDISRGLAELRRLRRLGTGQVMVIQAASGAGKSSFLKAGLWPRLERDPEFMPLAILRPATGILTGENGLGRQLAAFFATHRHNRTAADIHAIVKRSPAAAAEGLIGLLNETIGIGHSIQKVARPDAPVPTPIIAVDQAEELFAGADSEESLRFLALVAELLAPGRPEGEGRARLAAPPLFVWTLRADSLDALLHATDRAGIRAPEPLLLPPIPREAYREIIEAPIAVANQAGMRMSIDPLLVDALVGASTGADALPLLAFTLRQLLADHRSGATAHLTLAQFEAAGGMEGILGRRLAAVQRSVGSSPEGLRRLLLPHLATWDEEANPPAAKRLVASEAQLLGGDRADLKPLADALVEARLLTRSGGEGRETTLEVAHEALLRQSPISDWLAEDREFLVWRERLARTRAQFDANARGLLVGRELQIARGWIGTRAADVAEADRAFVEASAAEDERRRGAEEERERRLQAEKLAASQRLVRRTVAGLAAAIGLAVVAGVLGIYAFTQQQAALRTRDEALLNQSRFLTREAKQAVEEGNAATGLLLALEAIQDKKGGDAIARSRPPWAEAETALYSAVHALRERFILRGHTGGVWGVAVTPDGARIVTGSSDGTARVWDAASGRELLKLQGHTGGVWGVAVTPDGARIVTGSSDGTARVWDAASGRELLKLQGHTGGVASVAVTPDGARIVTGSSDRTVRVWDAASGRELLELQGHTDPVWSVAVTPDGARIVTGSSDRTARVWRLPPPGQSLIDLAKTMVPRCLTPAERQRAYLSPAPSRWCGTTEKWPYDAASAAVEGPRLVHANKEDEATALLGFAKALARDPETARRIDAAWTSAYIDRGGSLSRQGKDEEAKALFAQALARDPSAQKRINEVQTKAIIDRGFDLLGAQGDDATRREQKQREALTLFEDTIAKLRKVDTSDGRLADALFGRGRAHDALKEYSAAIEDFRDASRLGHHDAASWRWRATNGLARQMRDQGKTVPALLMAALNALDLTPVLKGKIGQRELKSSTPTLTYAIGILHADLRRQAALSIRDCDRVAHPFDPHRISAGVPLDSIDKAEALAAVAACDLAPKSYPDELRYHFQRARALSRLARLAEAAGDKAKASEADASALEGFKKAADRGYPAAFNNLAHAYQRGEGVAKDEDKAADLHLETFNRTIHCCWAPVARHLLEHEAGHDPAQVRRVVHELLLWARALGSEPARQMLDEQLYAKGTLTPPTTPPAEEKATFTSLPPWLR